MSLINAIPAKQTATFQPLGVKKGLHEGLFIGMSEPFEKYDYFNGCKKCGTAIIDPKTQKETGKFEQGKGCSDCDGTGKLKIKCVHLKYDVNGVDEVQVEEMSYKLSPPGQTKQGKSLSPSTLYLRMRTFFGETDPSDLAREYDAFEQNGIPLPVTLMVDDNATGKATKIKAVMLRESK